MSQAGLAESLPRPVAFVLGGGGSFGAAQVGMLEALAEHDVVPDLVVGTSIGAINGALVAADPVGAPHRLSHLWHSVDSSSILEGGIMRRLVTLIRRRGAYAYETPKIGRLVGDELDHADINDLAIPYTAMAIDADTTQLVALDHGPVLRAMLASSAIPGVFPPVPVDGRELYDGGLAANVPVLQALEMGARSMVVLDCAFPGQTLKRPANVLEAAFYSMAIVMRQQPVRDLPVAAERVPVVSLPGAKLRHISPLDFTAARPLIAEAYGASRNFLRNLTVDGPGLYARDGLDAFDELDGLDATG